MKRHELGELLAFLAVAEERSFTRAAVRLETSQSALSHTVRKLEARLALQLLTRTTRNVAPTDAGARLLETLRPAFDDIDARLEALTALREKPAGSIRITTGQHAAHTVLWPVLAKFLPQYPDILIEVAVDQALADLVTGRFDAGIRLGERVDKDMVAVRIGPELRLAVVGAPSYFADRAKPKSPHELSQHRCINLRLQTRGGFYIWEFEKNGREVNVRVDGQLAFSDTTLILKAAIDGFGLAMVLEDQVLPLIAEGRLVRVLSDWCAPFAGYHLYYPSRRQLPAAFTLLLEALRYRGRRKMG
jgi:DNA-binding transcriptional LysR family regulator